MKFGVRVVAFVKKGTTVSSGNGTVNNPYIIKQKMRLHYELEKKEKGNEKN